MAERCVPVRYIFKRRFPKENVPQLRVWNQSAPKVLQDAIDDWEPYEVAVKVESENCITVTIDLPCGVDGDPSAHAISVYAKRAIDTFKQQIARVEPGAEFVDGIEVTEFDAADEDREHDLRNRGIEPTIFRCLDGTYSCRLSTEGDDDPELAYGCSVSEALENCIVFARARWRERFPE